MRLSKLLCLLLCALFCISGVSATQPAADAPAAAPQAPVTGLAQPVPEIHAPRAALVCAETGQLLLGKDAESPAPPASITKIMTALLVLAHCEDMQEELTVSENAVHSIERDSTHIALDTGEVVTVGDMLAALLIMSANDAANVLAERVGGSLEGFAELMNQKAQELGCTGTHFMNAHGLDDPEHYVTAHDMGRITAAALKYEGFAEYAGAATYTMPATNKQAEPRAWFTKQNMLRASSKWYDTEVIAGKNGWTSNAHTTLVTVKRHEGITLIAVVMGATGDTPKADTLADTYAMFEYGFNQFHAVDIPADKQASVALAEYENADVDVLQTQTVLVPAGKKLSDISLSCAGEEGAPAIIASVDGEALSAIPLTLMTQGAPGDDPSLAGEGDGPAAQKPDGGMSPLTIAAIAAGAVAAVFVGLVLYRTCRVRRQRKRVRAMRRR